MIDIDPVLIQNSSWLPEIGRKQIFCLTEVYIHIVCYRMPLFFNKCCKQ